MVAAQRIDFSQHEVELIDRLVKDGVYADATEAVHEGLRLLERERSSQAAKLDNLRAEVKKGLRRSRRGSLHRDQQRRGSPRALRRTQRSGICTRRGAQRLTAMTDRFRLRDAADDDVEDILAWSEANFGPDAHNRYLRLLEAAVAHAAASRESHPEATPRPRRESAELAHHPERHPHWRPAGQDTTPHPVLPLGGDLLAVGRVLHEQLDPTLHLDLDTNWA